MGIRKEQLEYVVVGVNVVKGIMPVELQVRKAVKLTRQTPH